MTPTPKTEAAVSSDTLVSTYKKTSFQNPENLNMNGFLKFARDTSLLKV